MSYFSQNLQINSKGEELESILQFLAGSGEKGGIDLHGLLGVLQSLTAKDVHHYSGESHKMSFGLRYTICGLIDKLREEFPEVLFILEWQSFDDGFINGEYRASGNITKLHVETDGDYGTTWCLGGPINRS